MNHTLKYSLPQWEKSDRIVMEDFNSQAAKIEAALTAHDTKLASLTSGKADKTTTTSLQTQVNQKADTSALNTAVSSLQGQLDRKLVVGRYTGDGTENRTISLGFTPKAVLVVSYEGKTATNQGTYGGLAVTDGGAMGLAIVSGGFRVTSNYDGIYLNSSNARYNYIAVR